MIKSGGSLGGQNSLGRESGARSSRAFPTTIFKKLRSLDRRIQEIDGGFIARMYGEHHPWWQKLMRQRAKLDEQRKATRLLRKKYTK